MTPKLIKIILFSKRANYGQG